MGTKIRVTGQGETFISPIRPEITLGSLGKKGSRKE
jgi:hypothetical protein